MVIGKLGNIILGSLLIGILSQFTSNVTCFASSEIKASGIGSTREEAAFNAEINTITKAMTLEIGDLSNISTDNLNKLKNDYKASRDAFIEKCLYGSYSQSPDGRFQITVKCQVKLAQIVPYYKQWVESVSGAQGADAVEDEKKIYVAPTDQRYMVLVKSSFSTDRGYTVVSSGQLANYVLRIDYVQCSQSQQKDVLGQYSATCDGGITITKVRGGGWNAQKEFAESGQGHAASSNKEELLADAQASLFENIVKKVSSDMLRVWSNQNKAMEDVVITVTHVDKMRSCRILNSILSGKSQGGTEWHMAYDEASLTCTFTAERYLSSISDLLLTVEDEAAKSISGNKFVFRSNKE